MSDVAQFRQTPKGSPTPPENCASVISAGSAWQGSLKIDGSVRIEGRLSGDIETQETVHVMEGAQVDANVTAAFVVIAGTFQGAVDCSERLELMPKSRTKGELTTKLLTVHEGAFIDGQLRMQDPMLTDNRPAPARPSTAAVRPREAAPALSTSNMEPTSAD
jgi:cytoskeletal protein CcmA (bactofilin family)